MSSAPGSSVGSLRVVPLNGFIGAEIDGLDLREPLTGAQADAIRAALVRYEVIVLRNQDITLEQQMAFGRQFGELSIHPFSPNLPDKPEVIVLDYSADNPPALTDVWHSDETFRAAPPMATILRAKVVPQRGGDTLFASMTAAYRGLSERMKRYLHGLHAQHDFKPFRALLAGSPQLRQRLRQLEDEYPNPSHPVVCVHPESGRRVLYVNPQFTLRICELDDDESDAILQFLFRQAQTPEYQLRVKWQPNTVVMWDNRAVQHYAVHDYYAQRRTMERVTIAGAAPIGVGGEYTAESAPALGEVAPRRERAAKSDGAGPARPFERR
ncbi:MAG TPA: TauD/TfdA family dioxygenase [Burkholderiaceae bacterium]|nr:TauD/TfdA family dioxygenase [Burkholderiaceae bacterium]